MLVSRPLVGTAMTPDSMQHAVYETDRAFLAVFRVERPPWESLTPEEKQRYGLMLLALTVADRWQAQEDGRDGGV